MANTFITPDIIAREALMVLEDQIISPQVMDTSRAADFTGAKVGTTVKVRRPVGFAADTYTNNSAGDVTIQQASESTINLTLEKLFDVSFEVTNTELTTSIDDFNNRLLVPAMSALAEAVDRYALGKMINLGGIEAPAADFSAPNSKTDMAAIIETMNNQMIPMTNRKFVVSPSMQTALYNISEFVRANESGRVSPLTEAQLGRFMGLDMVMSQNLATFDAPGAATTANDGDGALAVATTAGKAGDTSVAYNGGTGSVSNLFKVGDHVTITYNSGKKLGHVVTAASSSTSGAGTLNILPPLYNEPATGADPGTAGVVVADVGNAIRNNTGVMTGEGTGVAKASGELHTSSYSAVGGAFVPEAFALAFVPMEAPMGPGTASAVQSYKGMSLRVMQTYDQLKKRDIVSVDCLVGCAVVDPRLGVVVPVGVKA